MVLVRPEDHKIPDGSDVAGTAVKVKTPKRVLQFCDGVLEEYSTDEEVDMNEERSVDPSSLTWGPWLWYKASVVLAAVDSVGEFFASFFGITTPRYYFELEEYKRREEEKLKQDDEERGWSQPSASSAEVSLTNEVSKQPKPTHV